MVGVPGWWMGGRTGSTWPNRSATSWAAQLRAKTARVSTSGRNVWKHSLYKGVDPENDFTITGGTQNTPQDFQTIGAPTYYTIRLAVTF